jgi:hypothetical protein
MSSRPRRAVWRREGPAGCATGSFARFRARADQSGQPLLEVAEDASSSAERIPGSKRSTSVVTRQPRVVGEELRFLARESHDLRSPAGTLVVRLALRAPGMPQRAPARVFASTSDRQRAGLAPVCRISRRLARSRSSARPRPRSHSLSFGSCAAGDHRAEFGSRRRAPVALRHHRVRSPDELPAVVQSVQADCRRVARRGGRWRRYGCPWVRMILRFDPESLEWPKSSTP